MTGWLFATVVATGQMVKAPRVNAMQDFHELAPDAPVWCDTGAKDGRPRVYRRRDLAPLED